MLKSKNLINLIVLSKRCFSVKPKSEISNALYCANNVKKFDYENFLCTLLIGNEEKRRNAFALRALNVELARIPSVVSDNKIALMRLKFWEDAIKKLFNNKKSQNISLPKHPVVEELGFIMQQSSLTKRNFDRLINARKAANLNFVTMKQMEQYAEETVSSLNYLLLETLDCKNVNADHAASHLGKAQGISNLLRSIYSLRSYQHLPIPQELLIKHGISQERFYRSKENDKAVENTVFDVATLAHQHLEKSIALMSKVPKEAKILFLPMVSTKRFLEKLRKVNFNLTDKSIGKRDNLLPLVLYWNKFKGL
ncbi:hypothetical protein PVAND_014095 [Polypedilum vanderplanki]|uniref:NADH dehydrogenase (Ubiquinone) complex I, assembly factor 6 n=1 Tax=Polypedilum vanderplanki TaxID=319348 RepID=A0A9J6CS63_POLVA|nr:hypothetical protein PVAND_014095 [Polypedilum vanderplanki]